MISNRRYYLLILWACVGWCDIHASDIVKLDPYILEEKSVAYYGISFSARNSGLFGSPRRPFVIAAVHKNSPADLAGLQVLDEIYAIDGNASVDSDDLYRYLFCSDIGDKIKVTIRRMVNGVKQVHVINLVSKERFHLGIQKPCIYNLWGIDLEYPRSLKVEIGVFSRSKEKHPKRSCDLYWKGAKLKVIDKDSEKIELLIAPSVNSRHSSTPSQMVPKGACLVLNDDGTFVIRRSETKSDKQEGPGNGDKQDGQSKMKPSQQPEPTR